MMRWEKADEWLLEKCIGGVRGMWRFCSYLKGSAGGFLKLFLGHLTVSLILSNIVFFKDRLKF